MNYVDTVCLDVIKPLNKERDKFIITINFSSIDWYTETEDIVDGEATNLIKFAVGFCVFLTTMSIEDFKKHLDENNISRLPR